MRNLNRIGWPDHVNFVNLSYDLLIIFELREAAKVSLEDYLKLEREKKLNEESLMNQVTQLQNDKDELKTEIFKLKHKVEKVRLVPSIFLTWKFHFSNLFAIFVWYNWDITNYFVFAYNWYFSKNKNWHQPQKKWTNINSEQLFKLKSISC